MRISGIDGTLFGRRDFLKVAVGAAAGVGVSGCRVFSSAHSATWERVRAEAVTGDPWAPDPACYLTDEEIGL